MIDILCPILSVVEPVTWTMFFNQMALTTVMSFGAMALSRALRKKPKKPDSFYSWESPTSSRDDVPYAWVFGRMRVQGNAFSQYRDVEHTSTEENHLFLNMGWFAAHGVPFNPTIPGTEAWNINRAVKVCRTRLFCRIGVGEGPILGFVDGKARFDGKLLADIDDLITTEKTGTDSQTASSSDDRIEYPQETTVPAPVAPSTEGVPITVRMPDKDYVRCGIILGFPNGFVTFGSDGDKITTFIGVKIEIRELAGAWHTLFNYYLFGKSTSPVFYEFYNDEQYSDGSPFTVTSGIQHEWKVTITKSYRSSKRTADMIISSVHAIYDDGYTFPGLAYREIEALPTEILNTQLDYEDIIDGLICENIDGTVLEWTDNPARAAKFVFTRPVIIGTGESGDPYTVNYYRGYESSKLHEAEFEALEAWCDETVSDGDGGTEKRFTFNASITSQMECWELAQKIGAMCRANFWFDGQKIRCWIDKPAAATHVVCMGNITLDSYKESSTDLRTRPKFIESVLLDENTAYTEEPIRVVNVGSSSKHTVKLEGLGCTRISQFVRLSKFIFDKSDNNDLICQWDMDTAGLDLEPGDVVYLQHDVNGRAHGGRIIDYGSDWVQIDKEPTVDDSSGVHNKLILQTIDATGKHVEIYDVDYVTYDYKVYLQTPLVYMPVVGDVYIFGEDIKIDKARITTVQIMPDASVRILAEQYKEAYYTRDSGDPDYDTLVYRSAIRGGRKTLKAITRDDLLKGLPEDRIFDGDELESIKYGRITFAGNGSTAVTWTCGVVNSGDEDEIYGWVRYKGVSYPINSDLTGTTLTYIYFDPNAVDPTTLKSTDDLEDLRNEERFILCLNVDGIAFPKPGLRVGEDAKIINLDDALVGALYRKEMEETFEDQAGDSVRRWYPLTPFIVDEIAITTGGQFGGKVLRVGDNSGNDAGYFLYYKVIPWDPQNLYRISATLKIAAGTGKFSLGVIGYAEDGVTPVDYQGNATSPGTVGNYYNCGGASRDASSSWVTYRGYFRGSAAVGDTGLKNNPHDPARLHTNVRYIRPFVYVNRLGNAGTYLIDDVRVESLIPGDGKILPGAVLKTTYTEVTSLNNGERFSNKGSSGAVTFQLCPATTELEFEFARDEDYPVYLCPVSGERHLLSVVNASMELTALGDLVKIGCTSDGVWRILRVVGTAPAYAQYLLAEDGSVLLAETGAPLLAD